jgi:CheY-like chemotaxis protein
MDFAIFENLVKDALYNMFDYAALESHLLFEAGIKLPSDYKGSKSSFLRNILIECIDSLKPQEGEFDFASNEWRSYIILSQRYVENVNSAELAKKLFLGERQIRRNQKKAIRAVALILWDRVHSDIQGFTTEEKNSGFIINRELINLNQVVQSVIDLLKNQFDQDSIDVQFMNPEKKITIKSDRIILRQIIIRIFHVFLRNKDLKQIKLYFTQNQDDIELVFQLPDTNIKLENILNYLFTQEDMIQQWMSDLNIQLDGCKTPDCFEFILRFISQDKKLILVVDDQEPALKMYERYLSRTNYKIFGLSKATKVLNKAIDLKPALILLDIMMPKLDGWEILQSLRVNEKTKDIPIVVCSAWGEPDLAKSLGANHFLRKPIVQRELLTILESILGE